MRARIGDLAIIRFDPTDQDTAQGRKWDEKVGLVIKCEKRGCNPREYGFIFWERVTNRIEVYETSLPSSRLIRARPKRSKLYPHIRDWGGNLRELTRDLVEPV